MIKLFSLVALLLSSQVIANDQAIDLKPFPSMNKNNKPELNIEHTQTIFGTCGNRVIGIIGVVNIFDDHFTIDSGGDPSIVIRGEKSPEMKITADATYLRNGIDIKYAASGMLSDHNGVACVSSHDSDKLLIWSNCGGSACGDNYNFYVIDLKTLSIIKKSDDSCDEACISKALGGSKLPFQLNGHKM